MPSICVDGAKTQGHGGFPPTTAHSTQTLVTVNGIPALLTGDPVDPHSDGDSTHGSTVASGSGIVSINGIKVARVGDPTTCGDHLATGDPLVTMD